MILRKTYLSLFLSINFLLVVAQPLIRNSAKSTTNTSASSNQRYSATTIQNMVPFVKHDTCLNKKFSIVFYVIQDSSFGINATALAAITFSFITPRVNFLNTIFSRICVSFEHCKTVLIPNYMYNDWDYMSADNVATSNYYEPNTINYYLPAKIYNSPCNKAYSYKPDTPSVNFPKNVIVSKIDDPLVFDAHAMGHFFGLPHTFYEINPNIPVSPTSTNTMVNSKEFVDRSNCYLHGDGFCDTDADPYMANGSNNNFHNFCGYIGTVADGKGNYYTPPTDNFMSFYWCICRFSQEQYNYMAYTILKKRMYLH